MSLQKPIMVKHSLHHLINWAHLYLRILKAGRGKLFINSEQSFMRIRLGLILLIMAILAIACIRFFMFTSTLSSPTTLTLYMPKDSEKDTIDQYSRVRTKLTLILLKDDRVFGYYGDFIKDG